MRTVSTAPPGGSGTNGPKGTPAHQKIAHVQLLVRRLAGFVWQPTVGSGRTLQLTRRVAGHAVALHARFAHIEALRQLLRIELLPSLRNTEPLLIEILGLAA